jgi:hypothetical protein
MLSRRRAATAMESRGKGQGEKQRRGVSEPREGAKVELWVYADWRVRSNEGDTAHRGREEGRKVGRIVEKMNSVETRRPFLLRRRREEGRRS